ncbi:MAG: hypothetical protein Kow0040_14760 [Thermogutta sp.]
MAAISGKEGKVKVGTTEVAQVTKWSFEETAEVDKFAHSGSAGYKDGVAGSKDVKGSIEAKFAESGTQPFDVGDRVSLELLTDGGATPKGSLSGDAIIASISLEVDIDGGGAVGFSASFEGVGAWTKTGVFAKT